MQKCHQSTDGEERRIGSVKTRPFYHTITHGSLLLLFAVLSVICMCFVFFVFAPVQRNRACFTWKGTLEIRSLLLLLFAIIYDALHTVSSDF